MGQFRCLSCGYSEPIPKTTARAWLKACPDCGGANIQVIEEEKAGLLRRLFGRKKDGPPSVTDSGAKRTNLFQCQGETTPELVDELIGELVGIARAETYFYDRERRGTAKYDERGQNRRALEIGTRLDQLGGMNLMRLTFDQVLDKAGPISARSLDIAWAGIGEWR